MQLRHRFGNDTLQGKIHCKGAACTLDQEHGGVRSASRINGFGKQGVEIRATPLTILPASHWENLGFPSSQLGSVDREVLVPEGEGGQGVLPPGDTRVPLNLKL